MRSEAHSDVFNILLQILDEPADRLAGAHRRFPEPVFIMTSNIGSPMILEKPATAWAAVETIVLDALRQQFPSGVPESLRRHRRVPPIEARAIDRITRFISSASTVVRRRSSRSRSRGGQAGPHDRGDDPAFRRAAAEASLQRLVQNPLRWRCSRDASRTVTTCGRRGAGRS